MLQRSKGAEGAQSDGNVVAGSGPYRIRVAAELSGVSPATLRAWERRYGIPVPRRSSTAYRLYTAEDVELVQRMRGLVESGVPPSDAARTCLASGIGVGEPSPEVDVLTVARDRLLSATRRWDGPAIDDELTRLLFLLDVQTLFARVISPLLVEVGQLWEEGELSVAQEHLLSERIELTLRAALRMMDRVDGPHVILGCTDGEDHVIGLLGAALRFSGSGASVTVLGASTPPDALADVVQNLSPRLVGLSTTCAPPSPRTLFRQYAKACGDTPWVVGGPCAESVAGLVEELGGIVAIGPAPAWSGKIRHWLRGAR